MDDRGIVALYLRRDETAIWQTAEKYGHRLRALAYGIVNDLQTAEECENDTYMEAWNTIPPYEPSDYFYAFLARITRHISLNRCRDRDRLKRSAFISELSAEMEQCIPAPDNAACRMDDLSLETALNAFLGGLDAEKRNIFVRRYWYLDSVADIAKRYGISESNELLDKLERIDPAYIEAADTAPNKRKRVWAKWGTAVACLCLICGLAIPAMAAFSPSFYELLYAVTPATAQFFKPVQRSCEDNGIRMEVTAAYIHENTAEIYLSMQDLTGTNFDETVDLFDSYRLHTPFDCTGHCKLANYDPDTHTATFLVTLEQWDRQSIEGEKLTFSVQKLLSGKKSWEGILDGVALNDHLTSAVQTVQPRGLSGNLFGSDGGKEVTVLKPAGEIAAPVDGVALTGIGYADGRLHVQVYYADILKTDNHGSISLVDRETGEQIDCDGSAAFFDSKRAGSYEDYIFTGIEADALGTYVLYGTFVTSAGPVEGNWSVTFPLENTEGS